MQIVGFPMRRLISFHNSRFRKNEEAKNKKPTAGKKTDKIQEKATPKNAVKQKLAKTDQKIKRASTTEKKIQQKRKDSANKTLPARINTSVDSEYASESALDQTGLFNVFL